MQSSHPPESRLRPAVNVAQRSVSQTEGTRYDDSWVEIASQPSSSSLSSAAEDNVTTGLRTQHDTIRHRRRRPRPSLASQQPALRTANSNGCISSQEEYEESESESDRVMTSSNEGLELLVGHDQRRAVSAVATDDEEDEDENRTAVNYPINAQSVFTPQPNAFSHPPSATTMRNVSEPVPGSYFPRSDRPVSRPTGRHSYSGQRTQHTPYNVISPSYNAAVDHDAALRASLSTLLSCAAAARGLGKTERSTGAAPTLVAPSHIQPNTLRLVPESALPTHQSPIQQQQQPQEPTFLPTIRRHSASTSASGDSKPVNAPVSKEAKRKAGNARSTSKERRSVKRTRRVSSSSYSTDELLVSPTLLTWVVSAGVVVVFSALSFSAGYTMGKDAGKLEAGLSSGGEMGDCAREAGRNALGLRRLRFTAQT